MAEQETSTKPEIDTIQKNERTTPDFWRRWIKSAEKAAEEHWEKSRVAWAEYENRGAIEGSEVKRGYPIYWSSCKTLEPAFYSRTPKITTERRFDINDDVASTACLIVERLGKYLVDSCDFDAIMQAAVADFIHADKSTLQLLYEHDEESINSRVDLTQSYPEYLQGDGKPWTGEVMQDATGFFGTAIDAKPINQKIYLTACRYDEILHTPDAKSEEEIREKAYYFFMNRDEAEKRFPGKNINWKSKREGAGRNADHDRDRVESVGEYIEGWEIWSKPEKKVYWMSNQCQDGFLDERDDPYKLTRFFPSPPFIIGSKPSKSLYPTPIFWQVAPLLEELHTSADKISRLIHGIRRRAVVDPSLEDLVFALESLEAGEFVVAKNFASIVEKGGVENLIWYIPVQELVQAINELTVLQEKFKNEFFEWFGVPDILRGATEAVESASAQQLKAESAHDRFKWQKKQIAKLAEGGIQQMVDLALGIYSDEKLAECTGAQFMPPAHQQRFPAALELLRSDVATNIRISIETDSMSFVDEQLRSHQANQAVQTITQGLKEISQMIQISPQAAAVGLQALLLTLDTMPAGKKFQDDVKQTLEALIEQAKQPPPEEPPPPDYQMMMIQIEQQKVQNDGMKAQLENQNKQRELERKEYELQLKSGTETAGMQLKQYQAQTEEVMQRFLAELEAQRVAIEQFKAQMAARESEMEEIRLAREVDAKTYEAAVTTAKETDPKEVTPPILNVINIDKTPEPPSLPDIMPML